ncbi:ATP synthase F1 subunit epsilon [Pokkaliibacter sp. CJK22405]|uniref:ATP synthase F1 subunit epsilon n=1 Tax=Pokkaliibacter sp. CJK22405 TaxID=3384615 RepID=UPI0039848F29
MESQPKSLKLSLVTSEEGLFSGEVRYVVLTTRLGDVGIYPGHAPLLAELAPGPLRCVDAQGDEQLFYVPSGFVEVQPTQTIVLADTAIRAQELHEAEAKKAMAKAEAEFAAEHTQDSAEHVARAAAMLRTLHELSLMRRGK